MIPVSDDVYMVLIKTAGDIWVWLPIALGHVIGNLFWSPSTELIYTFQQLFG